MVHRRQFFFIVAVILSRFISMDREEDIEHEMTSGPASPMFLPGTGLVFIKIYLEEFLNHSCGNWIKNC